MNKKIMAEIAKIEKIKTKEIAVAEAKAEKAKAAIVEPLLKELKGLLETLKEVAPKELEDTIRAVGLSLTTTNTAPSSEVMQEAFDKGQDQKVKKTRRSQRQKASAERAQKRAEKKAQDEAEALDVNVPEKYRSVLEIKYRSKKICRGLYKGTPFSAGVNVGGIMVFDPLKYSLEAEIEKVLKDCHFIDPQDLTKDPYKIREDCGSIQKLRSGDYCGYVVGSNKVISLFVKSPLKKYPCIMEMGSFMEGDTKPHASHDSLVNKTIGELIEEYNNNNPNIDTSSTKEIATTATVTLETPQPYSVGRDTFDDGFGDDGFDEGEAEAEASYEDYEEDF